MSKMVECIGRIAADFREKQGIDLSDEDLNMLFEHAQDILDKEPNFAKALRKIRDTLPDRVAWHKASTLVQRKRNREVRDAIRKAIENGENPHTAIEGMTVGSTYQGDGLKDSIFINKETLSMRHMKYIANVVGEDVQMLRNPDLVEDIFEAVDNLNKGGKVDPAFEKIANDIKNINKYIVHELAADGIEIRDRLDYIMRQTHDPVKMSLVSPEEWANFIVDKLDEVETFGALPEGVTPTQRLVEIYEDITKNGYSSQGAGTLGAARKLFFKDGRAAAQYHNKFGEGSVLDVLERTARSAAKAQSVHLKLGPKAKETLEMAEKFAREELKKAGKTDLLKKFDNDTFLVGDKWKREQFKNVTFGYGDAPAINGLTRALQGIRDFEAATKLQAAFPSTFSDVAVSYANIISKMGTNNFYKNLQRTFVNYGSSYTSGKRKAIAKTLGLVLDYDTSHRVLDDGNYIGRKLNQYTEMALKTNLLDFSTKVGRMGSALTWASAIANDFDGISLKGMDDSGFKAFRKELESFGIKNESQWKAIQQATTDFDGLKVFTPELIQDRDLQRRAANFLWHQARFGAISPTDWAKSFSRLGFNPNSTGGQVAATILQFKSFGVEATRTFYELNRAADGSILPHMSALAGLSLITGMAGLWARDIGNGKTPRDIDGEFLMESIKRGPMPLLYGYMLDVFDGTYANYYNDPLKDFMGPALSDAVDLVEMTSQFAADTRLSIMSGSVDFNKSGRQFIRNAKRMIPLPFINAPFVKPVVDGLLWNPVMQTVNPRFMRGREGRAAKQGQQHWIPLDFYNP